MRRFLLMAAAIMLLLPTTLHAQRFALGAKVGGNVARARVGDRLTVAVPELAGGVFADFPITARFALRPELQLGTRAVRWEASAPPAPGQSYILFDQALLGYVEAPVLIAWRPLGNSRRIRPYLVGGPSVAKLLACEKSNALRLTDLDTTVTRSVACDTPMSLPPTPQYVAHEWLFAAEVGLGVEWQLGAWLILAEGRYTHDITSIQPGAEPAVLGRRLTLFGGIGRRLN
jgi:hypothetical protein